MNIPTIPTTTKFAIAYNKTSYITSIDINFSHSNFNWLTNDTEQIPEKWLFDTYTEAETRLILLSSILPGIQHFFSIQPINVLSKKLKNL